MSKLRQEKVAALLKSIIAQYFEEHKDKLDIEGLILVDEVFPAADLKSAQAWISFNPPDNSQNKFEILTREISRLQSYLFKQLSMKQVPKVSLHLSDVNRYETLERIFDTLESHGQEGEGDSGNTGEIK